MFHLAPYTWFIRTQYINQSVYLTRMWEEFNGKGALRSVWMVALNLLLQKEVINLSQFVNLTISSQNLIVVFF